MTITYYQLGYIYTNGGRNGEPDFEVEIYCKSFNKQDCINLAKKYNIRYEENPKDPYYTGFVLYTITQRIEETVNEYLLNRRLETIKEEADEAERRSKARKILTPFGFYVEE